MEEIDPDRLKQLLKEVVEQLIWASDDSWQQRRLKQEAIFSFIDRQNITKVNL